MNDEPLNWIDDSIVDSGLWIVAIHYTTKPIVGVIFTDTLSGLELRFILLQLLHNVMFALRDHKISHNWLNWQAWPVSSSSSKVTALCENDTHTECLWRALVCLCVWLILIRFFVFIPRNKFLTNSYNAVLALCEPISHYLRAITQVVGQLFVSSFAHSLWLAERKLEDN